MKKTFVGLIALALSAFATTVSYASPNSADIGMSPPSGYQSQAIAKAADKMLIAKTDEVQTAIGLMASTEKTTPAIASTAMGTKGDSAQSSVLTAKASFIGIGSPARASTTPGMSNDHKWPGVAMASTTLGMGGTEKFGEASPWAQVQVSRGGAYTLLAGISYSSRVSIWPFGSGEVIPLAIWGKQQKHKAVSIG